jgi:hypothetical protein
MYRVDGDPVSDPGKRRRVWRRGGTGATSLPGTEVMLSLAASISDLLVDGNQLREFARGGNFAKIILKWTYLRG